MVTKRGLSDIVSNVLIILLVLVAVGILWLFLRPTITKAGNVGGAADCFAVDLSVQSCTSTGTVNVYRAAGGPKVLQEIRVVLEKGGVSEVYNFTGNAPSELQTLPYTVPGQAGIEYASVAGVIKSTDLNGTVCAVSQRVKCA